ncbi:hypothetical protein JTE90_013061 [Oedothorax gibbosus]|uniref:RNase H type-1 domain-containing protein n=1 Tax=Oedothorax gibbosus TaxID=931172 RepID=A0AAV6TIX8_9ARAC|nr:hypothetical protein JTE90_013061 [Oedothorax gibbosus]
MSSVTALNALYPKSPIIKSIRNLCTDLPNKNIYIYWIKAHIGLFGNEVADALAGAAVERGTDCQVKLPPSFVKKCLKEEADKEWQREWDSSDKGHGSFPSFLHKIGKVDNPNCVCGMLGSPEHYLSTSCYFSRRVIKMRTVETPLDYYKRIDRSKFQIEKFGAFWSRWSLLVRAPGRGFAVVDRVFPTPLGLGGYNLIGGRVCGHSLSLSTI